MGDEKKILQEDEIDLVELVKVIWLRKWFIAKVSGIFLILGLIIAFTSPKEYEASCTLIPEAMESGGKLSGSLGGLASLAGVDLGGLSEGSATINPGLYRSVAQSTPFLVELMSQKFYFEDVQEEITIFNYYSEHYKTSLLSKLVSIPGRLIGILKPSQESMSLSNQNQNLISLSIDQQNVINDLRERILVTMDWDLNIVSIEVEMQDARVAARMTEFTRKYITKYVTDYSISKSQEQLKFTELQYSQRKKEFEEAQLRLATIKDRNVNINSARARSEEERLQSEYNLAFNIYNQIAQQRESIKLQVNENTPVFTVLEPVKIPVEKSKPRKGLIVMILVFVGIIMSTMYVLVRSKI